MLQFLKSNFWKSRLNNNFKNDLKEVIQCALPNYQLFKMVCMDMRAARAREEGYLATVSNSPEQRSLLCYSSTQISTLHSIYLEWYTSNETLLNEFINSLIWMKGKLLPSNYLFKVNNRNIRINQKQTSR